MPVSTSLGSGLLAKDRFRGPRDDVLNIAGNHATAARAGIGLVSGTRNRDPVVVTARTCLPPCAHGAAQALNIKFGVGLPVWTL